MISRRAFIRNGSVAMLSLGFAPAFLTRTVRAAGAPARRTLLIAIFQRGAVDGLNVVVPFGEPAYYQARPGIGIKRPGSGESGAVDLDGFFGLHPRLAPLKALYDRRQLAVVHACGSPDHTRSHFDAQDFMETATPGVKSTSDGWLNRYLRTRPEAGATPFRAVSLTTQLPRTLEGPAPAIALTDVDRFGLHAGPATGALASAFAAEYAGAGPGLFSRTGDETFEAMRMLQSADPARYAPAAGADYPRSPFGQTLRHIAQLDRANVGLEVAFAEVGGWDTHVNQGADAGQLAARLDDFARSLAALTTDLGDRLDDTVILTMSEFGRAVNENGNGGTDHGHGNAMLAIGGRVRGGKVYGTWPGLSMEQRYEGRDLAVTTDFRDVFAEVAVRHLGVADASPIFPGYQVDEKKFRGFVG
ncbi:MAG TPA: DUF1501 domain-containing protein [Vicinamibacterales bacterium]|nr:DUF1501 domain-containing protein [Vicinamibacterales bacterium]